MIRSNVGPKVIKLLNWDGLLKAISGENGLGSLKVRVFEPKTNSTQDSSPATILEAPDSCFVGKINTQVHLEGLTSQTH